MAVISMTPIQKIIDDVLNDDKPKFGISTGLTELDNAILGLRPAHLIVIAGFSGIGKSAIATDIVLSAAKETSVALFSIEMGVHLLVERMIYNKAGLNYHRGISGDLSDGDKKDLKAATQYIKKLNDIYIDEVSNCIYPDWILKNPKEPIENSIETAIHNYYNAGCRVFLVDYLQIVQYGFKSESETLRIKCVTNKLHDMAIKYSVPIIILSQLKKEVGDRLAKKQDPTPSLSDIRDSGFIINDADIVLLLHRPDYFEKKEDIDLFANHIEDAKIIVGKQRSGPLGSIDIKFHSYCMSFKDSSYNDGVI